MGYRFLLPAEEEMTESAIYYESQRVGLGQEFLNEVELGISRIVETPEIGGRYTESLRRFVLARFPYSIVYAVNSDVITVIAISHHRREPGYWRDR